MTPVEAVDDSDVPKLFLACTVYVYCCDDCKPVTFIGLEEPVNVVGEVDGEGVTI